MNWFYWTTLTSLGVGSLLGGFRRKQDKVPRGKLGVLAAVLLGYGSLALGASFPGMWAASVGEWIRDGTHGQGTEMWLAWAAALPMVSGVAFWMFAAIKDVLKDKVPDEAALTFCVFWSVLVIGSLACVMGEAAYVQTFAQLPASW
ncbi:hypothetical protein [Planobispora rosea]|uniref:hypothetical protein n=1 Tax=Planobispora rosea TaxID=35762 RepID=UPI00083B8418|nr:hypothetical protein [Planobispora rosea]